MAALVLFGLRLMLRRSRIFRGRTHPFDTFDDDPKKYSRNLDSDGIYSLTSISRTLGDTGVLLTTEPVTKKIKKNKDRTASELAQQINTHI